MVGTPSKWQKWSGRSHVMIANSVLFIVGSLPRIKIISTDETTTYRNLVYDTDWSVCIKSSSKGGLARSGLCEIATQTVAIRNSVWETLHHV